MSSLQWDGVATTPRGLLTSRTDVVVNSSTSVGIRIRHSEGPAVLVGPEEFHSPSELLTALETLSAKVRMAEPRVLSCFFHPGHAVIMDGKPWVVSCLIGCIFEDKIDIEFDVVLSRKEQAFGPWSGVMAEYSFFPYVVPTAIGLLAKPIEPAFFKLYHFVPVAHYSGSPYKGLVMGDTLQGRRHLLSPLLETQEQRQAALRKAMGIPTDYEWDMVVSDAFQVGPLYQGDLAAMQAIFTDADPTQSAEAVVAANADALIELQRRCYLSSLYAKSKGLGLYAIRPEQADAWFADMAANIARGEEVRAQLLAPSAAIEAVAQAAGRQLLDTDKYEKLSWVYTQESGVVVTRDNYVAVTGGAPTTLVDRLGITPLGLLAAGALVVVLVK